MKNIIIYLITLSLFCSNICLSDEEVKYLEIGQIAPYSGYLFSEKKEKELHLLSDNLNYYKSLSDSLQVINKAQSDNLNIMQERINIRDNQIDSLSKRLNDSDNGFFTKAGYFIFGCIITGFIAQAIYRTK